MWAVKISEHLENRARSVGRCKVCLKPVQWAKKTCYWNIMGRKKFPKPFEITISISKMIASSATAERSW